MIQTTTDATIAAIYQCIKGGLTPIIRIGVAISPQTDTGRRASPGNTGSTTVRVTALVRTGTAVVHISICEGFTARLTIAVGISGITACNRAGTASTTFTGIWQVTSDIAAATVS